MIVHFFHTFTFSNDGLMAEAEAIVTLKGTFVLNLFILTASFIFLCKL